MSTNKKNRRNRKNHIGNEIRLWRYGHDLTQVEAAALFGVPSRTLECWEQGRQKPSQQGPIRRVMELSNIISKG